MMLKRVRCFSLESSIFKATINKVYEKSGILIMKHVHQHDWISDLTETKLQ